MLFGFGAKMQPKFNRQILHLTQKRGFVLSVSLLSCTDLHMSDLSVSPKPEADINSRTLKF